MVFTNNVLPFPYQVGPLTNITPFTYRDGITYLEKLERMRQWLNDTLVPDFNTSFANLEANFNEGIGNAETVITGINAEWETRFIDFMANVSAEIAALNDAAVAGMVNDLDSQTRSTVINLIENEIANNLSGLFINPAEAPYNVDFTGNADPAVVIANGAGLQAALDAGSVIWAPAGNCVIPGDIEIPIYTRLRASGIDITTFTIADTAGWNERGFIFPAGTLYSSAADFTIDGNCDNRSTSDALGGIHGTNISVVNSRHCQVKRVKSVNAMQHGFDATTPLYNQLGDGPVVDDPSLDIDFIDCISDQYGDDGFSTHGSGRINFTRCKALGTRWAEELKYANSNGFEADDYSFDITHTDCYATKSAHGFEAKAHGTQSAARNIRYIGCVSEANEVNFSQRHIGHHTAGHPYSLTAKSVQMIGCTSRFPGRVFFGGVDEMDGDVPNDETPAGMQYNHWVVGAYRGVTNTNFHMISDPQFNYAGSSAVLFHFRCEDIILDGYHIEGHTTGNWDIQATGGDQPAKAITIVNGVHKDSAIGGISTGAASQAIIMNNKFSRTISGSANGGGIVAYGNKIVRGNQFITPYNKNYNISNVWYDAWDTPLAANTPVAAPVA